jgi:hypothetical protein
MKFEVGDMIVCARDYGIVTEVEEFLVSVVWYEKGRDGVAHILNCTQKYRISNMIKAIDGEHNMLVKGNQC